ncbi:MAG: ATP-dependent zinc protease [Bdellovibrionaceae bacterium]|nr:ATP-dependent zinc protease [Pseudobdellovibrionaceae bacterium]
MASRSQLKPIIGWREWVGFPDLDLPKIKAKIDTGARTSSLHAVDLEYHTRRGKTYVTFVVHPVQRTVRRSVEVTAQVIEFKEVRSSNGHVSRRPTIKTRLELLGQQWETEVTLADRNEMGFRLLLGRQAIRDRFLVDVSRSYMGGRVPGKRR